MSPLTKGPFFVECPKGSVLGPLLLLLYINDFPNCAKALDTHLFTDDSNLFYADKSLLNIEQVINQELIKVNNWLTVNKLSLNIEKFNYVIFHPHKKIDNYSGRRLGVLRYCFFCVCVSSSCRTFDWFVASDYLAWLVRGLMTRSNLHTYIHTYIHTYCTYMRACMHTYIHTYIHTYCTYMHACMHTYIHV